MSSCPSELHPRPASAASAPGERPVFAAAGERRRRALRALGVGFAGLASAWLIALVLGVAGFDALPGVTLPGEPDRVDGPAPAQASGASRSKSDSPQSVRGIARSSPAVSAAAPARAIAGRQARSSRRAGSRRRGGTTRTPSNQNESGSPTQAQSPASSTPASPAVSSAPAPAAQQPAAADNGRGQPASPGDRRSATAGSGGSSGTATTAPAPAAQSESPGRSAGAPGQNR
jgi:hypothetical protein